MKIYLGNLPAISDKAIKDLFTPFGQVEGINLIKSKNSLRPRFFAYVEMARKAEGMNAIDALRSKTIDGNKIIIFEITGKK